MSNYGYCHKCGYLIIEGPGCWDWKEHIKNCKTIGHAREKLQKIATEILKISDDLAAGKIR